MEKARKLRLWVIVFAVTAGTVALLISNRAHMAAKATTEIITSVPVTVTPVEKQKLTDRISVVGTIAANNDVWVVSETQGRVTRVFVEVGDYVKAGGTLVQIDDELKRAALAAAEVNYEKTQKDLERFEVLHKQGTASDTQTESIRLAYKAAEAQYIVARRQYNDTRITSPIAGIITARPVNVGTNVNNGTQVANVVDIAKLKVKVNLAERDAFKIRTGDSVRVTTDVYPGTEFDGKVETISSKADESHTYAVEVGLPNSNDHPLKAGMFGRVLIVARTQDESLVIPRQSLIGSAKDAQVFAVEGSVARLRPIVLGGEFGDKLEVLSGLKEGEKIVVSGQNNLKDSVSVRVGE